MLPCGRYFETYCTGFQLIINVPNTIRNQTTKMGYSLYSTLVLALLSVSMSIPIHEVVHYPEECQVGIILDGRGYNHFPGVCNMFYQCYKIADNRVDSKIHFCRFGLFWSQRILTCVFPKDSECEDPCKTLPEENTYPMEGHCGGFWECHRGVSQAKCCPPGQKFGGKKCVADKNNACAHVDCGQTEQLKACDIKPVRGDPEKFQLGDPAVILDCPYGTRFDHKTCQCEKIKGFKYNRTVVCKPMLLVHFEEPELSRHDIESRHVQIKHSGGPSKVGSFGHFNGSAYMNLLALANNHGTATKAISFYVRLGKVGKAPQTIVTNYLETGWPCTNPALCGASIEISVSGDSALYRLLTNMKDEQCTTKTTHGWSKVWYIYDGEQTSVFGVQWQGKSDSHKVTGRILERQTGLIIGRPSGPDGHFFNGDIDEFAVYPCIPDEALDDVRFLSLG
ncbi:hypothetical protein CHS0354_013214 [Potamilus streckersoni]|uniref:Chitin-binding type-2 domain-containing protein n=1 Tax=Potamilus streckersoni TaxID=2493646 RepID=A0AAE0VZK6_9BIVA|nr:hypothetical protein CHS0354_013214 [Potamilus streckersoni]